MIEGLNLAAKCLEKSYKNISVVANNLANLNTNGYKKDETFFNILDDLQSPKMEEYTDFEQGEILPTSNPLDLALNGNAFFVLEKDGQFYYTKNGKFTIDNDGYLINQDGFKVMGQNGEISLSQTKLDDNQQIKISEDGEIQVGNMDIDQLLIAKIGNKNALQKVSSSNFVLEGDGYLTPEENEYSVSQGYLESSNVNAIEEMENMILTNKNFESAQKVVHYFDTSLDKANEIGRV